MLILAVAPVGCFPLVYVEDGQQWGLSNLMLPSIFVVTSTVVLLRARAYVAFGVSCKLGETVSESRPTAQLPRLSRPNLVGLLWLFLAVAVTGLFGIGHSIMMVATRGFASRGRAHVRTVPSALTFALAFSEGRAPTWRRRGPWR